MRLGMAVKFRKGLNVLDSDVGCFHFLTPTHTSVWTMNSMRISI
jgi:hypothetical protein